MDCCGHLRHQVRETQLIAAPVALKIQVHAVQILGPDSPDECVGERGGGVGRRRKLIERALVKIGHREHDTVICPVGTGDEVGQRLTLVAIPTGP
jgi:hypothetical protein